MLFGGVSPIDKLSLESVHGFEASVIAGISGWKGVPVCCNSTQKPLSYTLSQQLVFINANSAQHCPDLHRLCMSCIFGVPNCPAFK